jgi:hypothetical protein
MANTFELIASSTVGSGGASSIDFTSIPSTYTDLCLVVSMRTTAGGANYTGYLTFNGSSTSYSGKRLYGTGSSTASSAIGTTYAFIGEINGAGTTANTFMNASVYVPDYAGSTNKSYSIDTVFENNATTAYAQLIAGLWSNTSAITSMSLNIENETQTIAEHSTAYLYGVKNA